MWPNNTFFVFPGSSRWRIEVGTLGEYVLCGLIILMAAGVWYLNGVGLRSWFSSVLATPQMAVTEYRAHANTHQLSVKVSGFYTLNQKPVLGKSFEVVDAIDDTTLLVKSPQGHLITIGSSPTDTIQAKRAVIHKDFPVKVHSDEFVFKGQPLGAMFKHIDEETYISGTVDAHERARFIKLDLKPYKTGEFESIKISPGTSEFDSRIELRNASLEQLRSLQGVGISGELISRKLLDNP